MSTTIKIEGGEDVLRRLRTCGINTIRNVVNETQRTATQMENHSKENRSWTDRTGEARRRLYAVMEIDGDAISIRHGHGVEYGKYLELSYGGKYRIISTTVNRFRAIWLKNLDGVLSK